MKTLLAILYLAISGLEARSNESLTAHATFERVKGKVILEVSITNGGQEDVVISLVGSRGVTRSGHFFKTDLTMPGRHSGIPGTPVPRFTFREIEFVAPSLISKPFRGPFANQAQTRIHLPPGNSIVYYRFIVPEEWISSDFLKGRIEFPTKDGDTLITIPITQVAKSKDGSEAEQGGADQPATALESKSEDNQNPNLESEVRPQ